MGTLHVLASAVARAHLARDEECRALEDWVPFDFVSRLRPGDRHHPGWADNELSLAGVPRSGGGPSNID